MGKVKCHELRTVSKSDLLTQLEGLKQKLSELRVSQHSTSAKISEIGVVRKQIARVLTVYNQQAKSKLRETFAGEKFVPKELRAKKTRAIRRRLTPEQASKKVARVAKRTSYFPKRVFAVKA